MDSEVLSVGIDIGTSTTQVIFSRLVMENTANYFSVPKVSIVEKEVIYKSDIYITPLISQTVIDGDKIRDIVSNEFSKAGFTPQDTGTGAVIITGESARKENAQLVLEKLSGFAGDFVVSTAGPDLESIIAGKGSGAQKYSDDNACTAVNLDIGGGTTNIVVFDCGEVVAKGCYDIGGRQLRVDENRTVTYLSESAKKICEYYSIDISCGKTADKNEVDKLCLAMSKILMQSLGVEEKDLLTDEIMTSGSSPLVIKNKPRAICFSGGVADCIYKTGFDDWEFGDMGVLLGRAIRNGNFFTEFRPIEARETIRATVVGAGTYTTTISGSTISYNPGLLPLKNLPVLKLNSVEQQKCIDGDTDFLKEKMKWFLEQNDTEKLVLAMHGSNNPSYTDVKNLAGCISESADYVLKQDEPILLVVECDMAKALGQAVRQSCGGKRNVIAIDGIKVDLNDYIDLGNPMMNGLVIPAVVKTLIFG